MITPQEIQEKTFVKAVFGGYDMGSVDDFLEPLTEDYIALYKENAVLKSKMKILVEKLEEYRGQEESMKKALVAAQMASDQMIAEAEKKCALMTTQAESAARNMASESQQQIAAEEERIERAKQAALNFIEVIERDVNRHLELLSNLKLMNLAGPSQQRAQAYDFAREPAPQPPQPQLQSPPEPAEDTQEEIAAEISQNLEKVIGPDDDGDLDHTRVARRDTSRLNTLQFGRNYDPSKP